MDLFPLPESAATLAHADKLVGAMMDLASAIDERIQEGIAAVSQYASATVNGISGTVTKSAKAATNRILKASDKVQDALSSGADNVHALLQEHVSLVSDATGGGIHPPAAPPPATIPISGGTGSESVGSALPGQPGAVVGINPGGGCGIESFPLHLMSPDIAGGEWYYVAGAGGQWIGYGFVPPDFNAACWTVIGPFPEAPAAEAQFPNVPFFDPQQAPHPGGVVPLPGGQIAVPPGFSPTPINTPVGGMVPPHVPPFPPGVPPKLPPAVPPAPPAFPPSTIPIAPPVGPGQPGQPPALPYLPPYLPGGRFPPGVSPPPGAPPGGRVPPVQQPTPTPGGPYTPPGAGTPAPPPGGMVPPDSFSPLLVGYLPTPVEQPGNGIVTAFLPVYGPAPGSAYLLSPTMSPGVGSPTTPLPAAPPGAGGSAGGESNTAAPAAGLAPYLATPGTGAASPSGCPAPAAPSLSCPPPVINLSCGDGGGGGGGSAAAAPSTSRTIAVSPFADEIAEGALPGGCKPFGTMLVPFSGDPDFCKKMIPVHAFLHSIGSLILEDVPDEFAVDEDDDGAIAWIKRAINFILKWGGLTVRTVIKVWWGSKKVLRNCDWCALLGLDIIKWVISTLRHMTIGVSVLVKLEFVLGVNDREVDEIICMVERYICPDRTWDLPQVITADNNGAQWTEEFRDCMYRQVGADKQRWQPFIEASGKHASLHDHVMYARLTKETPGIPLDVLADWGLRNKRDQKVFSFLYDRPPSPHECIAFATNAITLSGFMDDYTLIEEFHERCWNLYKEPLFAQGITEDLARSQWAHAQKLPGESRLREALARCRPGRVSPGESFTPQDYMRHLAAEGIPPYWRRRDYVMTGKVMGPGQIGNLLFWSIFDTKEAEERLKDAGYTAADSGRLLQGMIYDVRHRNAGQIGGWTLPLATHYRAIGVISQKAWEDKYSHLGYSETDAQESLEVAQTRLLAHGVEQFVARATTDPLGAVLEGLRGGFLTGLQATSQLTAFGVPQPAAGAVVNAELYVAGVRRGKQAEMFLRRAFVRGRLDATTVAQRLSAMGFNAEYVAAVVPLWQLDQVTGPKTLTEGGIVSAYKNAVIDRQTATGRLVNLGWRQADADIRLATVDAGQEPKPLKGRRKRPPAEPGSAMLAKGDVKSLYVDGVIDDGIAQHILNALGYDSGTVDLLLTDWSVAREKKAGKAEGQPQQEPAPQG